MLRTKGLVAVALLIAAVAASAGFIYFTERPTLSGSVIEPPLPAAEIALNDSKGQPFRLSEVRGRVALIFFGYANCPDECPLTMANLKLAVGLLGSESERARVLFVTTDPERDTPQALTGFLRRFNPDFVGLTGTRDELARVWKEYGVTVIDGGEIHSNYIYVIDPSGYLVETLLPDAEPAQIAADIRALLD